jgi:hypothetical protein
MLKPRASDGSSVSERAVAGAHSSIFQPLQERFPVIVRSCLKFSSSIKLPPELPENLKKGRLSWLRSGLIQPRPEIIMINFGPARKASPSVPGKRRLPAPGESATVDH